MRSAAALDTNFTVDFEERIDPIEVAVKGMLTHLTSEAEERVRRRAPIERRWLEDLLQYHGTYDAETQMRLRSNPGTQSKVFLNLTRPKCNALVARLIDLLFPTDDRSWGIQPTPVPDLSAHAERSMQSAAELEAKAEEAEAEAEANPQEPEAPALVDSAKEMRAEAKTARSVAEQHHNVLEEAKTRAELMAHEIDDILKESRYQAEARDAIEDGVKLGLGVMMGPLPSEQGRASWQTGEDGLYALQTIEDTAPRSVRVDPWCFFPDPDARTIEECEGVYIRHMMNRKMMRRLAKGPGFDKDAIRRLLRGKPRTVAPDYINSLRAITGDESTALNEEYQVWQYVGPIAAEELQAAALRFGDEDLADEINQDDPLEEIQAILWFCDGELLKLGIYPLDSGESLFSVFCLERDESGILGAKGLPAIMRDEQSVVNAAWRLMMDNATLSAGPQIVIDDQNITPADGSYALRPYKVWRSKGRLQAGQQSFVVQNINSNQGDLAAIIQMTRDFIDEVTSLPQIAQGEQGSNVTKTEHGMALLMNSAKV
ncbi:MAG: hypothetical protein AAFQ51_16605, partial [Pseudomonadota bacterium]